MSSQDGGKLWDEKKKGGIGRTSSFVRVITDSYENQSIFHSKMFLFWITHYIPRNTKVQVAPQSLARMLVKDECYFFFSGENFLGLDFECETRRRGGDTHPDPLLFHLSFPFALSLGDQPTRDRNAVIPVTRKMYSRRKSSFHFTRNIFFFSDTQK